MRLFIRPTYDIPGNLAVQRALQVLRHVGIEASSGATFVDDNRKTLGGIVLLENDSDRYKAIAELEVAGIHALAG